MKCFVLLTVLLFASKNEDDVDSDAANLGENIMQNAAENSIMVKIEEDEDTKKQSYKFIGVHYRRTRWVAQRWSKTEKKMICNGHYREKEKAAHASDTLARKLMENGEQNHKLNFPGDNTEVHPTERKTSKYFGVYYDEERKRWRTVRVSKNKNKKFHNGAYRSEETAAHASDTLARKLMANGEQNLTLNFPNDNTEVHTTPRRPTSKYFGVFYNEKIERWSAARWNKEKKKAFNNGAYKDEDTAAHASDTLARKLMANGEQNHKLNFPDDNTEVYPERTKTSKYFGVTYNEKVKRWFVQRWNKEEKKVFNNGAYKDEETAAHASDTLARKLTANGEQNHKLNFPDDSTEVHKRTTTSKYFGVTYNEKVKRWFVQKWSKNEKKMFHNGAYKDEKTAAHASDTLARNLMENGEQGHKLNFPDDNTEVRKRTTTSKYFGVTYNEKVKRWFVQRWSKKEKKQFNSGYYKNEEKAAHASDTLARKLTENGEQNHKLNFPDDSTEVHKKQNNKRKRLFDFGYSQDNLEKFEEKEK